MLRLFRDFGCDQKGITIIEYALLVSLITILLIASLQGMGSTLKNFFTTTNNSLASA
jgi:Flp pilus assembly pilin Flp